MRIPFYYRCVLPVIVLLIAGLSEKVCYGQIQQKKEQPVTRILFIFDSSNSMYAQINGISKMEIAKKKFTEFLDSLQSIKNLELALRLYGHQQYYKPQDCKDTKLEVPFSKNNHLSIKSKVQTLVPKGTTPIAHSLNEAVNDFPNKPGVNIIILITDGIEECGGDPCEAAKKLDEKGISLRPFVIGVGLNEQEAKTFDCVGRFFDISDTRTFTTLLDIVITQTMNKTTAQVNLLSNDGNPSETNVNMTFYDHYTGAVKYNFIHTINRFGKPDTLLLEPTATYKIVTHTIPPVEMDSATHTLGKHNVFAMSTPQGTLQLKVNDRNLQNPECIVRKGGEMKTLNLQQFNTSEKYLVGNYDLEILSLPRIYLNDVNVSQSTVKTIEIPGSGTVKINIKEEGYGSILINENNQLQMVCGLSSSQTSETFILQPGNYTVVFRPKSKKESFYTVEKKFKVSSHEFIVIDL